MARRLLLLLALASTLVLSAAGPAAATNDPEFQSQYGLMDIKAPEAWAKSQGGGINVAVVSSGVAAHPDLAGKVSGGFDAVGSGATSDADGRGTHLAGIVGAIRDNGVGIAGVAPDARLLPFKAFESGSAVEGGQYLEALRQVQAAKPHVALIDVPDSFPAGSREPLRQALKGLGDSGISVVVGAQSTISLAGLPVLPVAATARGGAKAPGTPGATAQGVAAPGRSITSTTVSGGLISDAEPTFGYGEESGTSQAAAHAAGALALIRGLGASSGQAADSLRRTARKSADTELAAGLIDAAAAIADYTAPAPPPAATTTTKKAAAGSTTTTKAATGPTGPADAGGLSGPLLPVLPEPGEGEAAVVPPGAEDFLEEIETDEPSSPISDGDDRPLGLVAVGFGLLCGVSGGLSLTFRKLAGAPA